MWIKMQISLLDFVLTECFEVLDLRRGKEEKGLSFLADASRPADTVYVVFRGPRGVILNCDQIKQNKVLTIS